MAAVFVVVLSVVVCVGLSADCSLEASQQFVDNNDEDDIITAVDSSDTRPLATS